VAGDTTEAVSFVPPPLRLAIICCEASFFNEVVAGGVDIGRVPIFRRATEPSSLRRATESAELSDPETEKAPTEESTDDLPAEEVLVCLVGGTADAISSVAPPLRLVIERLKSESAGELREDPLEESLVNEAVAGSGGTSLISLVGFASSPFSCIEGICCPFTPALFCTLSLLLLLFILLLSMQKY
jgi:hypothetical protein